jgi:hypothetical protein
MATKTLQLAITKAAALPEAAQEQFAREMLESIEGFSTLRADIELGLAELDAGQGEELDIEHLIEDARSSP